MKLRYTIFPVFLFLTMITTAVSVYALQDTGASQAEQIMLNQSEVLLMSNQNSRLQRLSYDCVLADSVVCYRFQPERGGL